MRPQGDEPQLAHAAGPVEHGTPVVFHSLSRWRERVVGLQVTDWSRPMRNRMAGGAEGAGSIPVPVRFCILRYPFVGGDCHDQRADQHYPVQAPAY